MEDISVSQDDLANAISDSSLPSNKVESINQN